MHQRRLGREGRAAEAGNVIDSSALLPDTQQQDIGCGTAGMDYPTDLQQQGTVAASSQGSGGAQFHVLLCDIDVSYDVDEETRTVHIRNAAPAVR